MTTFGTYFMSINRHNNKYNLKSAVQHLIELVDI